MPDPGSADQTAEGKTEKRPRILLAWFSRQGTTTVLAHALSKRLHRFGSVDETRIRPCRDRGYWHWLALSFLPGSRVAIEPAVADTRAYDLLVLGFPKWTVSCPPINEYLRLLQAGPGTRFALFMSFGGFDQERFLAQMVRKLISRGYLVTATVSVKRRLVEEKRYADLLVPFLDQLALALGAREEIL
jgi:hypothetical protein